MIKSFAIISLLSTVVLAQGTPANTTNPLIPTGISPNCQTFLTALNSDSSLTTCTSTLITTTAAYGPGGSPSSADVTSSLGQLCSEATSNTCPDSLIRGKLADFYPACSAELTTQPNTAVLQIYDVLYALTSFKRAICTKDDSGKYCVTEMKAPADGAISSRASLVRRANDTAITPNLDAYRKTNLPFLFLAATLDTAALCTTCTRNVLTAYIKWELDCPYAPGLAQSILLGGQSVLYAGVQDKCGSTFLNGAVAAAGGLGNNVGSFGASGSPAGVKLQGPVAAVMGVLTLAVASLL